MTLKQKINWIKRGYADAREHKFGKRAPDYDYVMVFNGKEVDIPADIALGLCKEQAPEEVKLYREGWKSGILDNMRGY